MVPGSNPGGHTTNIMTLFLILGILMLVLGLFLLARSMRQKDKEGIIGSISLVSAGLILTIIFGIFYRIILSQ